jgi:cbb3-type cytochrome oxidase cytochrome c subunit
MKGLIPLVLGIFGTFTFSWVGLTVIPNLQIGHLDPQMDEEGTDVYPAPKSGMAQRGRRVYAANGCIYCHSQQVRADYAASDIDRKWGERRSAPRDYLFDRPVLLGKMRMGPDLSNIGKRAPAEEENASPVPSASPAGPPAAAASSPANPSASPTTVASPSPKPANSPPVSTSPAAAPASPAASPAPAPSVGANPVPAEQTASAASPAAGSPSSATAATPSPTASPSAPAATTGEAAIYSAAWQHRHLYSPRSISIDSNMPAYRFLYEKRRIEGETSANALKLTGADAPPAGWEIVPSDDAECLVAYLMSLDQSHPLKEVKSTAPAASPIAPPAASPAPAQPPK